MVAAVHGAGIRLDQALKFVLSTALLLSGFGVYALLRHLFSAAASLAGATVYLLYPYFWTRALYFVGDYPQLLGLLLLPVCLWAFTALHAQSRIRHWVAAVGALAALVFSHNLTTMVGAGVLYIYWLLLAAGYRKPDGLLRCALAALLAALLSAAFWLPALADLSLVQIDNARGGIYHFSRTFLLWRELFSFQSPFLDSRSGGLLKLPYTFGAASWLAVTAGLVSLLFAARKERRAWGLAGGLFALAMLSLTLPVSKRLWEMIPALSFLQFPFRFLGIAPLGALPTAALAVDAWPAGRRWLPGLILVMASSLVLFPYLFPGHTSFTPPMPVKTLSPEDTRLLERTLGNWGMTESNEFLVQGANLSVVTGQTAEPDATRLTWRSPHEAVADLSGQTEPMLLRLHFHPGWSAGRQAVLTPGPAGWVQVTSLRNPAQRLVIRWEGTAWQRWGERLSLAGLLASVAGLLFLAFRQRKVEKKRGVRREERESPSHSSLLTPHSSILTLRAMVGFLLLVVVSTYTLNRSSRGPFLWHSQPGQLAFAVEGQPATLGDTSSSQVTLLGWQLMSGATPKPGGTVRVRLYWQGQGHINEALHAFLHLYTPTLRRSWAVENSRVTRQDSQWWMPDKYYVDDLRLRLPADLPPATYSLVTGMVATSGERLAVPGTTDGVLHLRTLAITPTRPGFFQRERPSIVARAATSGGLRLQGYDLLPAPGGPTLRLFWETGDGVASDWITYIHLHSPQGERIAQFDGPALAGLLPTSKWQADALYIDRRQLNLPTGLEPGEYLLRVGLYNYVSGERLPFQADDEKQERFENGQLLIRLTVAPPSGAHD